MTPLFHLLWPKWRSINAGWEEGDRIERVKYLFFLILGLLFWVLIFFLAYALLYKVAQEPVYGDFLMGKLLSFLSFLFFAVLVFSNMVSSLTTFFLSDDLQLSFSSPIPLNRLFISRFIETILSSSWMVLLFAVPILIAYGRVFGASFYYYPWMIAALGSFLLLPAAIGTMALMLLVKAFPARKMHDVLIVLAAMLVVALYLIFRFLRPERLFNPDLFHGLAEHFATLRTPDSYFAPAVWLSESVLGLLHGNVQNALLYGGLLLSNGLMAIVVAQWLGGRIYFEAYSKSQEGRRVRLSLSGAFESSMQALSGFFAPASAEIAKKEIRSFFRETTQWTQLLLLSGLVVVYLFNFKAFDLQKIAGMTAYYVNLISFINIVLVGFLIAAVSVRFVLPLVSLEGQAFWIIKAAPISIPTFVMSKFFLVIAPLLIVAQVLILVSNYFLGASRLLYMVGAYTIFFMTLATTAMSLGMGAKYPNFKEKNIARLTTGASSIIYMILAMFYVVAVVLIEFHPVRRLYLAGISGVKLEGGDLLWVVGSFLAIAVFSIVVAAFFLRAGIRSLQNMEL